MNDTRERQISEIDRITSSNEFWALGSGDHQNMIDTLLEIVEEMKKEQLVKDLMIDSMIKSFDAIADRSKEEKTREYATNFANLNRDTLEKISDRPKGSESSEVPNEVEAEG